MEKARIALLVREARLHNILHAVRLLRRELDAHDTMKPLEVHLLTSHVVLQVAELHLPSRVLLPLPLDALVLGLALPLQELLLRRVAVRDALL